MENKRVINLIWDMDGTIVDSYPEIMERIRKTLEAFNISDKYSDEYIYSVIIHHSVGYFDRLIASENNIELDELMKVVKSIPVRETGLELIPNMKDFLEWTANSSLFSMQSFIYTHRGPSHKGILENLGVYKYFKDCVDSSFHFPMKPNPTGLNYLIDKYNMDKSKTYYIGDRVLDIECGKNAGVISVFINTSGFDDFDISSAKFVINDINEMKKILECKKEY